MKTWIVLFTAALISVMLTVCAVPQVRQDGDGVAGKQSTLAVPDADVDPETPQEEAAGGQILQPRPSDTAQAGDIGGIRPEFREAMDRCEAFFDEYAEFMEKYQSADDAIGMLADYADYLDRYVETMEEMEAVGQEELSEEELVFYMQVMLRIQEKLSGTLN